MLINAPNKFINKVNNMQIKRNCIICNKEFYVMNNKRSLKKITCGNQSCRSKLSIQKQRVNRTCILCEKEFSTLKSSKRLKCDKCRKKDWITCKICNNKPIAKKGSKTCSKKCAAILGSKKKIIVNCHYCNKDFLRSSMHVNNEKNQFCSEICKITHFNNLYKRSSKDYGDTWWDKRVYALERDKYKCLLCNSENKLQVHHFIKKKLFDDPNNAHYLENLGTFCQQCHYKIEKQNHIKSYSQFINERYSLNIL